MAKTNESLSGGGAVSMAGAPERDPWLRGTVLSCRAEALSLPFTRKLLAVLLALVGFSAARTQDIYFDWVKQVQRDPGQSGDESYFIGVDADRNVYLAGNFINTIDLDPGPGTFNVSGYMDHVFIVKLDPAGNFVWGKTLGGDRYTICSSMAVDAAGNVHLTGRFSGRTDFDPGAGTYHLQSVHPSWPEDYDIFICALDSDGNFRWAKDMGGRNGDTGKSIHVDAAGNVVTTGYFIGTVEFDPGGTGAVLGGSGLTSAFVTRHDRTGRLLWAKEFATNHTARGSHIRTDILGNVYITGLFDGTTDLDPGPGSFPVTSSLYTDIAFFVKLDPLGNFLWGKREMGNTAFVVDDAQQIIIQSGILRKYDSNGNLVWDRKMGGHQYFSYPGHSLAVDAAGNIYTTGRFNYTQDFDPGPGVYSMTANGNAYTDDIFVCRIDAGGNFVWAKALGGWSLDFATSLAIDGSGSVYTTGIYHHLADFDPGPAVYSLRPEKSVAGIFVHKMSPCTNPSYATLDITACTSYTLNHTTYTAPGRYVQTLANTAGCDSMITLNLVLRGDSTRIAHTACERYTLNGQVYTASGTYFDTLTNTAGCDSIVRLDLVVLPRSVTTVDTSICAGQDYAGYTVAGTYTDTFSAVNGCDSIRTLTLSVRPGSLQAIRATICEGELYAGYRTSGTYTDRFTAANGCDSVRTLELVVNPRRQTSVRASVCAGESYFAGGGWRTASGAYTDTLATYLGCDSIITTHLLVTALPKPDLGADRGLCVGETAVLVPGAQGACRWQDGSSGGSFTVTGTGQYHVTVVDGQGCSGSDTVRITDLYALPAGFLPRDTVICSYGKLELRPAAPYKSYRWSTGAVTPALTVDRSGVYWQLVTDNNNCTGRDTVVVQAKECLIGLYVPSAFSPNRDGKNDTFRPLLLGNARQFHFAVYNRWGEVVFQTRDLQQGWDGTYKGKMQDSHVFAWTCTYELEGEVVKTERGTVMLIR